MPGAWRKNETDASQRHLRHTKEQSCFWLACLPSALCPLPFLSLRPLRKEERSSVFRGSLSGAGSLHLFSASSPSQPGQVVVASPSGFCICSELTSLPLVSGDLTSSPLLLPGFLLPLWLPGPSAAPPWPSPSLFPLFSSFQPCTSTKPQPLKACSRPPHCPAVGERQRPWVEGGGNRPPKPVGLWEDAQGVCYKCLNPSQQGPLVLACSMLSAGECTGLLCVEKRAATPLSCFPGLCLQEGTCMALPCPAGISETLQEGGLSSCSEGSC